MNTQHQEFLKLYKAIHSPFVKYCSSRAFGWLETEDLVQETILKTLQQFENIKDKERLLGYMIGIANNTLSNLRRRKKFQAEWDETVMAKLESKAIDPETAVDVHYLLKAIEALPDKQKEAILLFEISGFSIKEIATLQESSEGATKTRLSRARKKLNEMLVDDPRKTSLAKRLAAYAALF